MSYVQVEKRFRHQVFLWRLERILLWGTGILLLFVILLGLFGRSPLSATRRSDGSLEVEYDRFLRTKSESQLTVKMAQQFSENNPPQIVLSQDYVKSIKVEDMVPAPKLVQKEGNRVKLVFAADRPSDTFLLTMKFKPTKVGTLKGALSASEGQVVQLSHYIYP